ncbi:putative ABC transport system ATP-binding protein [Keratinibaculum paraultunense]|uniref:Putative ABC transport system ATP-binding protein n=1 Tax=Keratinibaculum paraultunense TaxID=1278232 RepID=A0A4R3KWB9_9FIRM|nr:ATP-binding cassette domain-containing protein [Keratinibaculum paraultunense]QQY79209.1 ATP-binding cassette domain-containing protein [Keratinibaculum paraultunense]TCS89338.1 putative ABC transport system ATP-binding protein [Keratinibaculum paraultunense]
MKIEAKEISLNIKGHVIFENISFTIEGPQMVAITGPSGCGKTSLLNCLGLIQKISNGAILINGKDCSNLTEKERIDFWQKQAAFIYQDYGIIEDENVRYNITFSNKQKNDKEISEILKQVGLINKIDTQASVLSGGEKQRLGIARALYKKAKFIFADEPTASLDAKNREIIIDLLKSCVNEGAIVILATHDERLSMICNSVINMGKI